MLVINFSHPLSSAALEVLNGLLEGQTVGEVKQLPCQVDHECSFADQAAKLVDAVGWSPNQWQQNKFILIPPGFSAIALAVAAEIHGRTGYFPAILRLKPIPGTPPVFMPGEIVDLASVRDAARQRR